MHFVQAKGILSANGGMNLYRGCMHNCIYCDSRSLCYQFTHDFEDIEVKENALILLEDALSKKRKKCMIATGGMTDPYLPLERTLRYTEKALSLIHRYGFGLSIHTKSDLILRDLPLLKNIHQKSKCVVSITLTTYDEALCKIIEPNVCSTKRRIEVLHNLKEAGIPTIVWLTPILPFLNDTEENILSLVNACKDAGIYGIIHFGMGLTLRDGNREYFYQCLDKHFPGLKQRYIRSFGQSYECLSPKNQTLSALFHKACEKNSILHDNDRLFAYMREFPSSEAEQLSMWD